MNKNEIKNDGPRRLYDTRQFAALCGISRWTIFAMVKDGKLKPIVGIGKGWKWAGDELATVDFERL